MVYQTSFGTLPTIEHLCCSKAVFHWISDLTLNSCPIPIGCQYTEWAGTCNCLIKYNNSIAVTQIWVPGENLKTVHKE